MKTHTKKNILFSILCCLFTCANGLPARSNVTSASSRCSTSDEGCIEEQELLEVKAAGSTLIQKRLSHSMQSFPQIHVQRDSLLPKMALDRAYMFPSGDLSFNQVKKESMLEANLTCSNVSLYGAASPKIPKSFLARIDAMKATNSSKTSRYNFQGSLYLEPSTLHQRYVAQRLREWVLPFVESQFSDTDILRITDAPENHTPLGAYDHTNEHKAYRPRDHPVGDRQIPFDSEYYQNMIQSTFTLCPGGDAPWSMRFYEAILAGSIPVIKSVEYDFNGNFTPFFFNRVGYIYFTTSQVPSMTLKETQLKHIADHNYELLLQYQTWVNGDQVPPAYAAFRHPCSSYGYCERNC